MTSTSASAGPLPERVEKAAWDRIAAGIHQTLVFGVVDGDNSEVVAFGKLDDGRAPDGDTVYEIGWRGPGRSVPPPTICCAI